MHPSGSGYVSDSDDAIPVLLELHLKRNILQVHLEVHFEARLRTIDFLSEGRIRFQVDDTLADYYENISQYLLTSGDEIYPEEVLEKEKETISIARDVLRLAFPGETFGAFMSLIRGNPKTRIDLEILITDPELDAIPWELLSERLIWRTYRVQPRITVHRTVLLLAEPTQTDLNEKLLLVSASPLNKISPNAAQEFEKVREHLDHAIVSSANCRPKISVLNDAIYSDFVRILKTFQPSIVHLSMDGNKDGINFTLGKGHEPISYEELFEDLISVASIRLIILGICNSARPGYLPASSSFAKSLAEQGITCVIGMASRITPTASFIFFDRFYGELAMGSSVLVAYARAIGYLRTQSQFEKILRSVPMLYQTDGLAPFKAQIAARAASLDEVTYLPVEYLDQAAGLFESYIEKVHDVKPKHSWSRRDWKAAMIPLQFNLVELYTALDEMKTLPAGRTPHQTQWKLQLLNFQSAAAANLQAFDRCINDSIPSEADVSNRVSQFQGVSGRLVDSFRKLVAILPRL